MNWDNLDTVRNGVIMGLIAPVIGFFVYGLIYTGFIRPFHDLHWFMNDLFLGTRSYQAPVLSLSLIANVPLFFWLNYKGHSLAMKGVLTSMFIFAAIIVVLWI